MKDAPQDALTITRYYQKLVEVIESGKKPIFIWMHCPHVFNPRDSVGSDIDLLDELALKYDRVVIDSSPVIPVTDSRIIAALSDVVLLVLRAEKSTRKAAEQAREALLSVGGRLLGAVANAAPQRRGRYGYYSYGYYGYGDGYGYGYGHKRSRRSRNKEKPGEEAAA